MVNRLLKIAGLILVVFLLLGLIGLHLVDFRKSPEEIAEAFRATPFSPERFSLDIDGRSVFGVAVGDPAKPCILFVHGSPGTWDNFLDLMADHQLLQVAYLIAFDRPGFGGSGAGQVEESLSKQAAFVAQIVEAWAVDQTAILVGHSYGGAVLAQTAVDFPERVSALVMIAASVSPALEKKNWYNHLAKQRLINWALPEDLVTSNQEILPLKSELARLQPRLGSIRIPVVIIHGERDILVPFGNVAFMTDAFTGASLTEITDPDWGHFVLWEEPGVIREALLRLVEAQE